MKKISYRLLSVLIMVLMLCGCGKKEKSEYEIKVSEFTDNINKCGENINAIDVNSENSSEQLLTELDKMNQYFTSFAAVEVPEKYETNKNLAEVAMQYMNKANTLYHAAFESEVFDEASYTSAKAMYDEAMKYASYIGSVLMDVDPTKDSAELTEE